MEFIRNAVKKILKIAMIGIPISCIAVNAQYVEDALRYSKPHGYPTARAAALGISYLGIVDDISAMYYNPAGLTLIPKTEFSIGMNFLMNKSETLGFNSTTEIKSNKENFNNIGIVSPFMYGANQDKRGSIGVAYHLENNFHQDVETAWFNTKSTFSNYLAVNYPEIAYHVFLSPETSKSETPVKDSLTQNSSVMQSGGIHNITGAGSFEVNPNFSIGFSIVGKWGTYQYNRQFQEMDTYDKYKENKPDYSQLNFNNLEVHEEISQDVSGIGGSLGILGKVGQNVRISAAVKFPTYYEITESYSLIVQSNWDDGSKVNPYTSPIGSVTYKVRTPFSYNAGLSFYASGLVFTTGIEYTDASQLEFSDASLSTNTTVDEASTANIAAVNRLIVKELIGQVTWGFGAEYSLPMIPVTVRASYTSTTSPYQLDVSGADKKVFAFGGGVSIAKGVRVDGTARFSKNTEFRTLYGNDMNSRYSLTSSPVDLVLNLTVRF